MNEKNTNRAALIIGICFACFGAFMIVGSWAAFWMDTGIVSEGMKAEAVVINTHHMRAADGDSEFIVDYEFTDKGGLKVVATHSIPEKKWRLIEKGSTISVHYSPENPKRNFPEGGGVTTLGLAIFVSIIGLPILILGSLLAIGGMRPIQNETPNQ